MHVSTQFGVMVFVTTNNQFIQEIYLVRHKNRKKLNIQQFEEKR